MVPPGSLQTPIAGSRAGSRPRVAGPHCRLGAPSSDPLGIFPPSLHVRSKLGELGSFRSAASIGRAEDAADADERTDRLAPRDPAHHRDDGEHHCCQYRDGRSKSDQICHGGGARLARGQVATAWRPQRMQWFDSAQCARVYQCEAWPLPYRVWGLGSGRRSRGVASRPVSECGPIKSLGECSLDQ